eukprot:scaffold103752_cov66-Phaeocystis_antarctica.AAC.3
MLPRLPRSRERRGPMPARLSRTPSCRHALVRSVGGRSASHTPPPSLGRNSVPSQRRKGGWKRTRGEHSRALRAAGRERAAARGSVLARGTMKAAPPARATHCRPTPPLSH